MAGVDGRDGFFSETERRFVDFTDNQGVARVAGICWRFGRDVSDPVQKSGLAASKEPMKRACREEFRAV